MSELVLSLYDPMIEAYRDVSLDNYKKWLESAGDPDETIAVKIRNAIINQHTGTFEMLGFSEEEIEDLVDSIVEKVV